MKYKAKIILSDDVSKKIKWFTNNFDKEIGAVGSGKVKTVDGQKVVYIEKLFFPRQKVTGATVEIEGDMWSNLIQNPEFMEVMDKICFYWHKHPSGSAHHSHTDEEETFASFMNDKAGRKMFSFMQTAKKSGGMDIEARIDIRSPVRVTIQNDNIEVLTEDELGIEKECEEILDTCIIKEEPKKKFQFEYEKKDYDVMDNDFINGYLVANTERVSIDLKHGQVILKMGRSFEKVILNALDNGKLKTLVKNYKIGDDVGDFVKYTLQPHKKGFDDLKKTMINLFERYNNFLLLNKDKYLVPDKSKDEKKNKTDKLDDEETEEQLELDDYQEILAIINSLEYSTHTIVINSDKNNCIITDDEKKLLGSMWINDTYTKATVKGSGLLNMIDCMPEVNFYD